MYKITVFAPAPMRRDDASNAKEAFVCMIEVSYV